MSKTKDSEIKLLELEKAHLDWRNIKTQLIIGLALIAVSMAIHFSQLIGLDFAEGKFFGCHLRNLSIYFGCAVLLSLLTLNITGRFGNRLGATPALWAAALFSVYPLSADLIRCDLQAMQVELSCFFLLLGIYSIMQWNFYKETIYLRIFLTAGIFLFLMGTGGLGQGWLLRSSTSVPTLGELNNWLNTLLLLTDKKDIWLTAAYTALSILLLSRIFLRITKPIVFASLCGGLGLVIFLLMQIQSSTMSDLRLDGQFYGSALLCLLLSFMALPAVDNVKLASIKIMIAIGTAALSVIFLVWSLY